MSSMIIPMGFGGAGASGGSSFIQIYADAPQYIEGKYLRVSLGGDEIYADSIPTNVDAITLQITEAGTYTIGLYASSSSATAEESHTVLVGSLTASPSVHLGERLYKDTTYPTIQWEAASDTAQYTSSSFTKETKNGSTNMYTCLTKTMTIPHANASIRVKLTGTLTATYVHSSGSSFGSSVSGSLRVTLDDSVIYSVTTPSISNGATSGTSTEVAVDCNVDRYLNNNAGDTITLKVEIYSSAYSSSSSSTLYVNTKVTSGILKVCYTSHSFTPTMLGYTARSIKSIQRGKSASSEADVTISPVNVEKSIGFFSQGNYFYLITFTNPELIHVGGNSNWAVIEFY